MKEHFYDIIQFQLSMWLLCIIPGTFILYKAHQPYLLLVGFLFSTFSTISNTIKVLNDKPYKYYMTLRLLNKKGKIFFLDEENNKGCLSRTVFGQFHRDSITLSAYRDFSKIHVNTGSLPCRSGQDHGN